MSKATRNDVARLANVSTAVVSYVFNNGPRHVSEKTTKKVLDAAKKLDYKPNPIARALRTGNSNTFGAIINDLTNPFNAGVYEELEMLAAEHGYSILFATSHGSSKREHTVIKQLIEQNVEALFVSPCENIELIPLRPKACRNIIFDVDRKINGVTTISADYKEAMLVGMEHLFNHGHTNISLIIGKSGNGISDGRVEGWHQAYMERGVPTGHIEYTDFTRVGGYEAMMRILDLPNRPTAVFAGSDLLAIGALRALHERHVNVPNDMAIISFDGTVDSQYTYPELTTMEQNPQEIARLAFKAAIDEDQEPTLHLIKAKLVIRKSCGCNG
ncbi:LacI family DNA-binding transcriptional regulator [Bifidobacterium sp. ESL0800]|uniref:LacI family DNA-binding transcriptional regulator n=1 Tax=Bifidobacterium sp. ESL0800 TaxID=2983236 RepID=UPI0023F86875|nr:LacI family DNA-binding transcriptional regulator [Bifidobacterium sp. ESL0800]WEV75387.1 LacI family DNA-binding transcriptional regulator [Bifidobacterium sp. ESL0800]